VVSELPSSEDLDPLPGHRRAATYTVNCEEPDYVKPPAFDSWLSHGWGIQVDTPHQLFRIISHIALLAQERTYAWRGQNDSSWDLSWI